jgi:aminocarboxymuconate-semialdehyde decarboxylase
MLPMHFPAAALAELARARTLPGVRGVYMATQIAGRELSDATFFPVYEAIEAAGLPVFLHPNTVIGHERLTAHYLANLLGNPFETAIAAAHLIFGGVLDRFPRLTFCLPHAGGAFPYLVGRLQRGFEKRPELVGRKHGPLEYLRRFYYDTISYHGPALDYLKGLVGADRVMMGSDYCFPIALERPVETVTGHAGFSPDEQALIVEGNARRLLGL